MAIMLESVPFQKDDDAYQSFQMLSQQMFTKEEECLEKALKQRRDTLALSASMWLQLRATRISFSFKNIFKALDYVLQ